MRILCLIAFVFLATSFTTNNENFENVSNSESLEVVKPTEYLVTSYKKTFGDSFDKVRLKVNLEKNYGMTTITIVAVESKYNYQTGWNECGFSCNAQKVQSFDALSSQFDYVWQGHYFNI